jgi:deazaflavin-dependent oxidoreductase (nitroreductase family)
MLMPVSLVLAQTLHHLDGFLLRVSGSRFTFTELVGLPMAQLTTKGAKTGALRSLPLVAIPIEARYALIATNFGQKHNPAWYYNLKAHPECELSHQGRSRTYRAREIWGEEYKKYWQLALTYYAGYEKYKERAAPRSIPILILETKE